jgi:hypothetical protein
MFTKPVAPETGDMLQQSGHFVSNGLSCVRIKRGLWMWLGHAWRVSEIWISRDFGLCRRVVARCAWPQRIMQTALLLKRKATKVCWDAEIAQWLAKLRLGENI